MVLAWAGPALAQARPSPDCDGDGVPDARDACPDQVGLDPGGCPPRDRDADGVLDQGDACPDRAGPRGNHGCPDGDLDSDGVVDRRDRCPAQPGPAASRGCPAGGRPPAPGAVGSGPGLLTLTGLGQALAALLSAAWPPW